jgi:hypothetical protein
MISERHLARYLTRELHFLGYFPSDDFVDLISEITSFFIDNADEFSMEELSNYLHISVIESGYAPIVVLIDDISDLVMKYIEDNNVMEVDWEIDVELEKD